MGDGQIFLKSRRNVSFKKGLSNEPTFGLIHLAGQYLEKFEDFLVYTGKGRGVDLENPPKCIEKKSAKSQTAYRDYYIC
jgi:hypothetical protein